MTKVTVYRLQNRKTGKYLNNIDTSSMSISFTNPGTIYSTDLQLQKLYQRVEVLRAAVKKTNEMRRLAPKTSSKTFRHSADTRQKRILKQFDECDLKAYDIVEDEKPSKEKDRVQVIIDETIVDSRMTYSLSGIARNEFAPDVIVAAYREMQRKEINRKKFKIIMVAQGKSGTEEFLTEHGLDFIHVETFKYKAFLLKSKKDINYINLLDARVMGNHIEVSKLASLEKRLAKKYNARVKSK